MQPVLENRVVHFGVGIFNRAHQAKVIKGINNAFVGGGTLGNSRGLFKTS